MEYDPLCVQSRGKSPTRANEPLPERTVVNAYEDSFGRRPGAWDRMRAHVAAHLLIHMAGQVAQRYLTEGGQVANPEEFLNRPRRLVRDIDFSFSKALDQLVGGEVHEFGLVRAFDDAIRHGLSDGDAGDLGHDVVETLDVLHVERRVDTDPRGQKLFDILISLSVS